MLENVKLQHQPIELSVSYSLEDGFGLMNLSLPRSEYLRIFDCLSYSRMFDHYNHYMWALYGKELHWKSDEENAIYFKDSEINVNIELNPKARNIESIKMFIENKDTFLEFLNIFRDETVSIKYCKTFRVWNKIDDMSKASGIEIEIDSPKTADERRELIRKTKETFGNNVYIETEASKDYPLEFTSNVVNLDNLESTYDIIEFLVANGCSFGKFSNTHIHISKDYFGSTHDERLENLHKVLILDYYHGKQDSFISNDVSKYLSFTDDLCRKYGLDIHDEDFMKKLHKVYHDKDASTKEDIYPRIDYFKWYRDPDNYHSIEFKWCSLKDRKTFEDSVALIRQYLSVVKYTREELFEICESCDFEKVFGK